MTTALSALQILHRALTSFESRPRENIRINVASVNALNFVMTVGVTTEKVEVTTINPPIELGSSAISGVVGGGRIRELPLNGRDWTQLATLEQNRAQLEHRLWRRHSVGRPAVLQWFWRWFAAFYFKVDNGMLTQSLSCRVATRAIPPLGRSDKRLMADVFGRRRIDRVLSDVGGVIADAFEMAPDEHQVQIATQLIRIFRHSLN